jgi:hypothetical protein
MKIICVDDEKLILDMTVGMCRSMPQTLSPFTFKGAAGISGGQGREFRHESDGVLSHIR